MTDINIIVMNNHWDDELERKLFGPLNQDEAITRLRPDCPVDMWDILVLHGFFPSRGQARKNWTRTGSEIPDGFWDFRVGKLKRRLTIWKPIDTSS